MYEKKDCCVIASTGFGKSLIYQFPSVFMKKLAIVISPLVALMQDQVYSLQNKGIKACFFGCHQKDKTLEMADHNIVYITPEYYYYGRGKEELAEVRDKIMLFAIDEAHVLEQWGNDFRPAYRKMSELREDYPNIPIIALTATAPKYLQDMITSSLGLQDFHYTKTALDRPNLEFEVRGKTDQYKIELLPLLRNVKEGSAIVYCLSRKLTERISSFLNDVGIASKPYHAKLPAEFRKQVVKEFRSNKLKIVICTIAFGMGIDKPDVRLVVHYGVSKSLEAYYQEAGRAGRDGKPSKCVLFHCASDFWMLSLFIEDKRKKIPEHQRQQQRDLLARVDEFTRSDHCRRMELLNYLGTTDEELNKLTIRNKCCDNCKQDLMFRIPPKLQYCDVNEDGKSDFTRDAKNLFVTVHKMLLRKEIVSLLLGTIPTREIFRYCKLESLGLGRNKPEGYWNALMSMLIQQKFLRVVSNTLRLDKKAVKFLGSLGGKILLQPSLQIVNFMEKIKDVEFFWKAGAIESRPKKEQIISQLNSFFDGENEDMDVDALLEVCAAVESESMTRDSAVILQCKQENYRNESSLFEEDDDELDSSIVEACEFAEICEKMKNFAGESSRKKTNDQMEIESLKYLSFDVDDSEEEPDGENLRKRNSVFDDEGEQSNPKIPKESIEQTEIENLKQLCFEENDGRSAASYSASHSSRALRSFTGTKARKPAFEYLSSSDDE